MAKVLNLDAIAPKETRELVIGGETHQIKEMSVQDFIETTKAAEKLEGEKDLGVQINETINMISRACPTVKRELLMAMSLEQLQAVTAFIRGADPETIVKDAEESSDEEKKQ